MNCCCCCCLKDLFDVFFLLLLLLPLLFPLFCYCTLMLFAMLLLLLFNSVIQHRSVLYTIFNVSFFLCLFFIIICFKVINNNVPCVRARKRHTQWEKASCKTFILNKKMNIDRSRHRYIESMLNLYRLQFYSFVDASVAVPENFVWTNFIWHYRYFFKFAV